MHTEQRRLYLRVTVKLLLWAGLLAMAYALLRSLPGSPPHSSPLNVDLRPLPAGQVLRLEWQGRRILVLHRAHTDTARQRALGPELLDPDSRHSRQAENAQNPWRSPTPDYFVALDYDSELNCPLDYVDALQPGPAGRLWYGGFLDRCGGHWYDQAGRVYAGQGAARNLTVPAYGIEGQELRLGEE